MTHYQIRGRTAGIAVGALALAAAVTVGMSTAGTASAAVSPHLSTTVAPGGNFNLSVWELQEPIGSPGSPNTIRRSVTITRATVRRKHRA